MKKSTTFTLLALLMISICFFSFDIFSPLTKKTYIYTISKGGNNSYVTTYTVEKKKKEIRVTEKNKNGDTSILYSPDYEIQSYIYKSHKEETGYTLKRNGGSIIADGVVKGRRLKTKHYIGKRRWVQEFTFGLIPLLKKRERDLYFHTINPNDFSEVEMVAKKEFFTNFKIDDKEYPAQKIELTLPGFKGLFWEAEIYYDRESMHMLSYKANEGPNTPITTILFEKTK